MQIFSFRLEPTLEKVDVVVVRAGVVGLAIAAQVAREDREIYVLERETSHRRDGGGDDRRILLARTDKAYILLR